MTTATATKKSTLSETVLEASKALFDAMTIDTTTGVAIDVHKTNEAVENIIYSKGVTKEVINQYKENIETVMVAGKHAFGQRSIDAYAANADLKTTEITLNMTSQDKYSMDSIRSKEYRNFQDPDSPITKHVIIQHDYETVYDKNIGQMKLVGKLINDLAAEVLK